MTPRFRTLLGFVLLVALAARVWILWQLRDAPFFDHPLPGMDQATYLQAGEAVADGDLLARTLGTAFAPLYPYFIALAQSLGGEHRWTIYLVQLLLGLGTVWLVFAMARRWFGNLGAVAAALLYGLYGPALYYEAQVLEASLAAFLLALGLYAHQRLAWRGRAGVWSAVAGASLGLVVACWPRGVWLLIPSWWSLWRQTRSRPGAERTVALASYATAFLLIVVPVAARAYALDGSFLPSKREIRELLLGNLTDKKRAGWAGSAAFAEFARTQPMNLQPVLGHLSDRIAREPLAYGRLWTRKLVETWSDHEIPANTSYALSASESLLFRMPWSHFALLLGLAFIGAVASWRLGARLPVAWVAAAALGTYLLIPDSRSRLPWTPILALLAGAGVAALAGSLRPSGGLPKWVLAAGLALLIGSFVAAPAQPTRDIDFLNAAGYYLGRPNLPELLATPLGEARDRRVEAAAADLQRARELILHTVPPCGRLESVSAARVRDALVRALSGLSAIHQDQADGKAARAAVDGILWVAPSLVPEWVHSAMLHKFENEPEELVRELQIAAILSPNDAQVHEHLAIAFGSIPKVRSPSRSRFHLQRMLETNPHHPQAREYQQSLQKVTMILAASRARVDLGELSSRAYQLAAEGFIDRSIDVFGDVLKYDTSNVADFEQVAGLYLEKKDYRRAADCLLDAAVQEPDRVDLLLQLADVYERLGDPILAREFVRQAAGRGSPDNPQVAAALKRLDARLQDVAWAPPGAPTPCGPAPPLPGSAPANASAQK